MEVVMMEKKKRYILGQEAGKFFKDLFEYAIVWGLIVLVVWYIQYR